MVAKTPKKAVRKISEADFTRQVLHAAKLLGWKSAHFRPGMNRRGRWLTAVQGEGAGFPDLVLVHRRKRLKIVAELKVGRNTTSKEQNEWLETFEACGIPAYTWRPSDWEEIKTVLEAK